MRDLDEFDIHAAGARNGAECRWAEFRHQAGLYHSSLYGGFYVTARYDDVMEVLMNPELYGSQKGITLPPPDAIRSRHIPAEVDPPEHREYRKLIQPLLAGPRAKAMEPDIRETVVGLLDAIPDDGAFDFVKAFARPLPIHVALGLMSLPPIHAETLENLVEDLHHEVATGTPTGAADRLKAFAEKVLDDRRETATDPDSDVVASILLGEISGRALRRDEQMSMVRLLMVGGFDTTSIALATMMQWVAGQPERAEALRGDPKAIELACEEIVRFSSPSTYLRREVMRDCTLGGTALKQGDSVLVAFGAANRDPCRFANAEQVVPDRRPNPHVGFGAGRHRCVGSFVAKAQMRIAFEEIFDRFDSFTLEPSPPPAYCSGLGQGLMSLPMRMKRRA